VINHVPPPRLMLCASKPHFCSHLPPPPPHPSPLHLHTSIPPHLHTSTHTRTHTHTPPQHKRDTLVVAFTIAGIESAVVVSPRLAHTLRAAPYHLSCVANLTADPAFRTNSSAEIFNWAHATYGKYHIYIIFSVWREIFTLRYEKLHTET
jgi:hypothetical protein